MGNRHAKADHPRGIHNVNSPGNEYVDATQVDFTAIPTGSPGSRRGLHRAIQHNRIAVDWIDRCGARGRRVLMVNFAEGGFERKGRSSGGIKNFTAPGKGDWALRIIKAGD